MRASSLRWSGAVLVMLGLVIGTLADRAPSRPQVRAGEYWILSGDFHVHAFPGDGSLSPWILRSEAARAGLDVIAVTNHNQAFTGRLARWISSRSDGPMMLAGQEITNPRYHMIAAGIETAVDAGQPPASAAAAVHAQGGVAIAAHPSPRFHGYDENEAIRALDGTEAAHTGGQRDPGFRAALSSFYLRARGVHPGIAAIGSSDFHAMRPALGRCRTYLFVRELSEAGVLEAIRNARTLAVDGDGSLQGDRVLIDLLGDRRPPGPSDEYRGWRQISILLAWIGMLVILAVR